MSGEQTPDMDIMGKRVQTHMSLPVEIPYAARDMSFRDDRSLVVGFRKEHGMLEVVAIQTHEQYWLDTAAGNLLCNGLSSIPYIPRSQTSWYVLELCACCNQKRRGL